MTPGRSPAGAAVDDVIRFLEEAAPETGWRDGVDAPLFGEGRLDSLALVQLVVWVEEQIGARIDPARFDLPGEWATVAGVAAFVTRHRHERESG